MGSSIRAELNKSGHRAALWVLVGVFVVLGLVFNYIVPFISWRFPASTASAASQQSLFNSMLPGSMLAGMISGFPAFGGAIALILGALLVGSEFSWETLKTIFTLGPTRRSLLQSKLVVLLLLLLITTVLTLAAGAAG
ncbi:MAG TPA: ABC transporter permease subunit, partial [Thermomicrobiaceae bacterium]|nr:ABC transporter permease subunit [Thermomicrobiaceae bacterium]